LSHALEKGSDQSGKARLPSLPDDISKEFAELLIGISNDCLEKAGLQVLSQKLKALVTAP
jgi:hypothetical protein